MNKNNSPSIFIAHSSKDKYFVDILVSDLVKLGLRVWYDSFEILVGHDIVDKVYDGLRSCDYIIVVLTKNAVKSKWVKQELSFAKMRAINENGKRVILPLLFDDCAIPALLKNLHYADFRVSYNDGLFVLAQAFGIHITKVKTNPMPDMLWFKIEKLLGDLPYNNNISIADFRLKVNKLIEHYTRGFVLAVRSACQLTLTRDVIEERYMERADDLLYKDMFVIIGEYSHVGIVTACKLGLEVLTDKSSEAYLDKVKAISVFKDELRWRFYSNYFSVKHESHAFALIREMVVEFSNLKITGA